MEILEMGSGDFENEWWDGFAEKEIKEDVVVTSDIVGKLWGEQIRNPIEKTRIVFKNET